MSRDREKKRDQEDEEEAYERRKLERKLRDKEAAYQEVGKNYEFRTGICLIRETTKWDDHSDLGRRDVTGACFLSLSAFNLHPS